MRGEILVHFPLPLQKAVLFRARNTLAAKRDGCRCSGTIKHLLAPIRVEGCVFLRIVGEVLVALLAELQLTEQLVRHFLALSEQVVEVIIIWIANFVVG